MSQDFNYNNHCNSGLHHSVLPFSKSNNFPDTIIKYLRVDWLKDCLKLKKTNYLHTERRILEKQQQKQQMQQQQEMRFKKCIEIAVLDWEAFQSGLMKCFSYAVLIIL